MMDFSIPLQTPETFHDPFQSMTTNAQKVQWQCFCLFPVPMWERAYHEYIEFGLWKKLRIFWLILFLVEVIKLTTDHDTPAWTAAPIGLFVLCWLAGTSSKGSQVIQKYVTWFLCCTVSVFMAHNLLNMFEFQRHTSGDGCQPEQAFNSAIFSVGTPVALLFLNVPFIYVPIILLSGAAAFYSLPFEKTCLGDDKLLAVHMAVSLVLLHMNERINRLHFVFVKKEAAKQIQNHSVVESIHAKTKEEKDQAVVKCANIEKFLSIAFEEVETPMLRLNDCLEYFFRGLSGDPTYSIPVVIHDVRSYLDNTPAFFMMFENMRTWGRLQRDEIVYKAPTQQVSIRTLIADLDTYFRPTAAKRNITIEQRIDDLLPQWVYAHGDIIKCILKALVLNAIQNVPDRGNVVIGISNVKKLVQKRKPQFDDMDFDETFKMTFVVSDNGCGVKMEELPHLFEPFYSVVHNVSNAGLLDDEKYDRPVFPAPKHRTGLGLSIAQGLLDVISRHNERIQCNYKPHTFTGSEFSFTLTHTRCGAPVRYSSAPSAPDDQLAYPYVSMRRI